eukprot:COSAG01_NODE_8015_length_2953_cov_2.655571_1_plen_111_part_00
MPWPPRSCCLPALAALAGRRSGGRAAGWLAVTPEKAGRMAARLRHLAAQLDPPGGETPPVSRAAAAATEVMVEASPFPLFGPGTRVDDVFVRRFVTEGFAAIVPQTEDGA